MLRPRWPTLLVAALLWLAAPGCDGGASGDRAADRPRLEAASPPTRLSAADTDVLWLTLCTLRPDHLGAYGRAPSVSPGLDELARDGVLFERVVTGAPWTRPAVASMQTGIHPRTLDIESPDAWPNDRALHPSFRTAAEQFRSAGYATVGITANPNTNAAFGFDQGYDFYRGTAELWRSGYAEQKIDARQVTDLFLERVDELPAERRLFAHLLFVDTHTPYLERSNGERTGGFLPRGSREAYDLQIAYLDGVLSELLAGLRARGRDDLLVVVTSDHGEGFGDAGPDDVSHGTTLHDSVLWIPWILYHPALEAVARRVPTRAEAVDILPTVLELVGLPVDGAGPGDTGLDGRSHAAVIEGRRPPLEPRGTAVETRYRGVHKSAWLAGGWKLVVDYSGGSAAAPEVALYHPGTDRMDRRDRSAEEPTRVREAVGALSEWQRRRDARRPTSGARGEIGDAERAALRALGYVDDD